MEPDIRDTLKSVISDKGFIQAAVARKANLSSSKLSSILNKGRKLEANELFAICDAIGMSPMDLRSYSKTSV